MTLIQNSTRATASLPAAGSTSLSTANCGANFIEDVGFELSNMKQELIGQERYYTTLIQTATIKHIDREGPEKRNNLAE
jgi:hypothetical protein